MVKNEGKINKIFSISYEIEGLKFKIIKIIKVKYQITTDTETRPEENDRKEPCR